MHLPLVFVASVAHCAPVGSGRFLVVEEVNHLLLFLQCVSRFYITRLRKAT